jgi:hypothetical protein
MKKLLSVLLVLSFSLFFSGKPKRYNSCGKSSERQYSCQSPQSQIVGNITNSNAPAKIQNQPDQGRFIFCGFAGLDNFIIKNIENPHRLGCCWNRRWNSNLE